MMLGYAGAIDALIERFRAELGEGTTAIATGGIGGSFVDLCRNILLCEPNLTLDGLVIAYGRLAR
jgi:type III pantothenate kinase